MMLAVTASLWLAVRTDVMPAASCASSPADESVEAAQRTLRWEPGRGREHEIPLDAVGNVCSLTTPSPTI